MTTQRGAKERQRGGVGLDETLNGSRIGRSKRIPGRLSRRSCVPVTRRRVSASEANWSDVSVSGNRHLGGRRATASQIVVAIQWLSTALVFESIRFLTD